MRLNKFIAQASGLSRRAADEAIASERVTINGKVAALGAQAGPTDIVCLDDVELKARKTFTTIMLNKPVSYVCSRNGQGSHTVYNLLPQVLKHLKPVGRLDKDSSGLLLMTDDGDLAQRLTHPSYQKTKVYEVTLDKPLEPLHQQMISDFGITLEDGFSRFTITKIDNPARHGREREQIPTQSVRTSEKRAGEEQVATATERYETRAQHGREREACGGVEAALERSDGSTSRGASPSSEMEIKKPHNTYQITMHEGRNRQIRRTFAALGYTVTTLHRTHFGPYALGDLPIGQWGMVA